VALQVAFRYAWVEATRARREHVGFGYHGMMLIGHLSAIGPVGYILRSLGLATCRAIELLTKLLDSRRHAGRVDALYLADDLASAGDIGAGVGLGEDLHKERPYKWLGEVVSDFARRHRCVFVGAQRE
jgi:hypothetical protein